MGQNLSVKFFAFINDLHILLGSGVLGILLIIKQNLTTYVGRSIIVSGLTSVCFKYIINRTRKNKVTPNKIVFITGCDSGLGYSLALHSCDLGFTVVAGCLNDNSEGSKKLQKLNHQNLHVLQIDITVSKSIESCVQYVQDILIRHPENVFYALINNAGIMVFGEFEWQTDILIGEQLNVNLLGTMLTTKAFLPLLRNGHGRIITVTSHCAWETLPGLSPYGATKSALSAWSDGLRVELNKYGIQVTTLIPGSFIQQSNIMSKLTENVDKMESAMTREQLDFYGDYFNEYVSYLGALAGLKRVEKIDDKNLYKVYENSLLDRKPRKCYVNEPWRYAFYHTLFKISPVRIRDYFVAKFIQMPQWNGKQYNCDIK